MERIVSGTCSVDGCRRPVWTSGGCGQGLCHAHYSRLRRARADGRPVDLSTPIREYRIAPWQRVVDASIALANAESDEDFTRAKKRLAEACIAWRPEIGEQYRKERAE